MSRLRKIAMNKVAEGAIQVEGYEGSLFDSRDVTFKVRNDGTWKNEDDADKDTDEIYGAIKQWIVDHIDSDENLYDILSDVYDEPDKATLKQTILNADGEWSFKLV